MSIQTKNDALSAFEETASINEKALHIVVLFVIGFPKSYRYQQVVLPTPQ